MATYVVVAYTSTVDHLTLAPEQLLLWTSATVQSVTAGTVRMQVRNGLANGLPENYDLILSGSFTSNLSGQLTGGTVTTITGETTGGLMLSQLQSLSIDLNSLLSGNALLSPAASGVLGGADTLVGDVWNDTLTGYGGGDRLNGGQGDDSLFGGNGDDTLLGGDGADSLRGGNGLDSMFGGDGLDRFFFGAGDVSANETVDGEQGSDRLVVDGGSTVDFQAALLTSIEKLNLNAGSMAILRDNQLFGSLINELFGGAGTQTLQIEAPGAGLIGSTLDLTSLTLTNWGTADLIIINGGFHNDALIGSAGNDSIIGGADNDNLSGGTGDDTLVGGAFQNDTIPSNGDDTLYGGEGADALYGNGGDDDFRYLAPSEIVAGETIDGGRNTDVPGTNNGFGDALDIRGSGVFDFRSATMTSIERMTVNQSTGNVTARFGQGQDDFRVFSGNQNNPGQALTVEFYGTTIDLRNLSFALRGANDTITLLGTNTSAASRNTLTGFGGAETIVGTAADDSILGWFGIDLLQGFAGNDDFGYASMDVPGAGTFVNQAAAGETIDGGADYDRIRIGLKASEDFAPSTIIGIEELDFALGAYAPAGSQAQAALSSTQIGGNSLLQVVNGEDEPNIFTGDISDSLVASLVVRGAGTNLSTVSFVHWDFNDRVKIEGTAGGETLVGSTVADSMSGFAGADSMTGGDGNDTIDGGDQNDTLVGGIGNDSLTGGNHNDTLIGGVGTDNVDGGEGDDVVRISAGELAGIETMTGGNGVDTLDVMSDGAYDLSTSTVLFFERLRFNHTGTVSIAFDDRMFGSAGFLPTIEGAAGGLDEIINLTVTGDNIQLWRQTFLNWTANDTITLNGTTAGDVIRGSQLNDIIIGGAGGDDLRADPGDDTVDGGTGNDTIYGGSGVNALEGGGGFDRIMYGVASTSVTITHNANGTKTITGSDFTDTLSGVEVVQFFDGTQVSLRERTNKADLSADGRSDILLRNSADGSVFVWEVNGTSLGNSGFFGWTPGDVWKARGTGDFNADGRSDVLLQNSDTGQSFIWFSDGLGSAVSGASGTVGWAPGANWIARATGDFNGDGRSDILLQDSTNGQCFIFLTNGTSMIASGFVGPAVGANWVARATGDFNGDGKSDILFQNSNDGASYIWNIDGTNVIGFGQPGWTPGADWQVRGTGDFNRDGKSDILLQNAVSGQLFTFMVDGTTAINSGFIGTAVGANTVARGTSDFNGDGQSDILFQDTGSGTAYVWNLEGTTVASYGQVGWVPGAQWEAFV